MKLTDLLLNRFLYKTALQNLETKDVVYESSNNIEAPVPPIASGGAAQDINTSNVFINGINISPGSYLLTVGDWGWGQTSVFSSTTLNTVSWTSGSFIAANGNTYAIGAGNTGAMSAKTYIYLDLNVSTTAYQHTTVPGDAVGIGKVVVAVAQNGATSATFNTTEANQIVGDNVLANSINASKIVSGSITATQIAASTITADRMNVSQLSSITANIGSITSGTITGVLFRTATSGQRIEMDTTNTNQIRFYDSSTLFGQLEVYKVGADGYIGLIAQDDGAGFEVYTGVGASAFSSSSVFSNGGSFDTSGNASNGFNNITGKYGGQLSLYSDGGSDHVSVDVSFRLAQLAAAPTYASPISAAENGTMYYNTVSNTIKAYVNNAWTDLGSGGGGANQALSNLTNPTSVNQHLLPGANATYDIGASAGPLYWRNLFIGAITASGNIGAGGDITAVGTAGGSHVASTNEVAAGSYISATTYVNGGTGFKVNGTEVISSGRVLENIVSVTGDFLPTSDATYYLGNSTHQWFRVYVSDNMYFRGIAQGITYFGYCSNTTISRSYISASWTLSHPSTGNYTITHNLNSSLYMAVVSAVRASGAGAYSAKVESFSVNSFNVIVFDDTGAAVDSDFTFIVIQK